MLPKVALILAILSVSLNVAFSVECTAAITQLCVDAPRLTPTSQETIQGIGPWTECPLPVGCPYPDEPQCPAASWNCFMSWYGCCGCFKSKTMQQRHPGTPVTETVTEVPCEDEDQASWKCLQLNSGQDFTGWAARTPLDTPYQSSEHQCLCSGCTFVTSNPKNGDLLWRYPTAKSTESSAAVAEDGGVVTVYFSDDFGNAYAIQPPTPPLPAIPKGHLKWKLHFSYNDGNEQTKDDYMGLTAPTVVGSDVWFAGSGSGRLYKVTRATGLVSCYADLRARKGGWGFTGSAAVNAAQDTIYIGSGETCETGMSRYGDSIFAVKTSDCSLKWTFQTTDGTTGIDAFLGGPIVDKHQNIIGASQNGFVYRIKDLGNTYQILGKFSVGATDKYSRDAIFSPPSLASDGTVYFGSNANKVFALPADFSLSTPPKWTFSTNGEVFQPIAVGSNGYLYFGCEDGKLYCLRDKGSSVEKVWEFSPGLIGDEARWTTRCAITTKPGKTVLVCNDQTARNYYAVDITDPTLKPASFFWEIQALGPMGTEVVHSPSMDSQGKLFLPGGNCIYGVHGDMPLDTSAPWPMYHHDSQFSGLQSSSVQQSTTTAAALTTSTTVKPSTTTPPPKPTTDKYEEKSSSEEEQE